MASGVEFQLSELRYQMEMKSHELDAAIEREEKMEDLIQRLEGEMRRRGGSLERESLSLDDDTADLAHKVLILESALDVEIAARAEQAEKCATEDKELTLLQKQMADNAHKYYQSEKENREAISQIDSLKRRLEVEVERRADMMEVHIKELQEELEMRNAVTTEHAVIIAAEVKKREEMRKEHAIALDKELEKRAVLEKKTSQGPETEDDKLQEIRKEHKQKLNVLKEEHKREIDAMKETHTSALAVEKKVHAAMSEEHSKALALEVEKRSQLKAEFERNEREQRQEDLRIMAQFSFFVIIEKALQTLRQRACRISLQTMRSKLIQDLHPEGEALKKKIEKCQASNAILISEVDQANQETILLEGLFEELREENNRLTTCMKEQDQNVDANAPEMVKRVPAEYTVHELLKKHDVTEMLPSQVRSEHADGSWREFLNGRGRPRRAQEYMIHKLLEKHDTEFPTLLPLLQEMEPRDGDESGTDNQVSLSKKDRIDAAWRAHWSRVNPTKKPLSQEEQEAVCSTYRSHSRLPISPSMSMSPKVSSPRQRYVRASSPTSPRSGQDRKRRSALEVKAIREMPSSPTLMGTI